MLPLLISYRGLVPPVLEYGSYVWVLKVWFFNKKSKKFRIGFDCVGVYDTSTLVGHFVSSPREREKSDRRDSRRD